MRKNHLIIVFSLFFSLVSLFSATKQIHAQTMSCQTPAEKIACQAALDQVLAEQKQAEKDLAAAQGQSASLARDIAVLNARIRTAELNIKAKNLLIQTLGNDITQKQIHINNLEGHIEKGKSTLASILRKTNELDQYSLPEVILSQSTVSGFFQDVDAFEAVQDGLKATFEQIRSDQASTTAEKNALDRRRNIESDARYSIQQDQKNIEADQRQKSQLLTMSKGSERTYSTVVADKKAKAASIRAALFSLRDAAAIPFGQAYEYATAASRKTGVRPALILAVLTQESSLGRNVGSCYLTNNSTGDGVNAKTGTSISRVMSPNRDVAPFMSILASLGGESSKTLVSCPQSVGWGGAMGPSQFIASTWILMKDSIASALGLSGMPDPWNAAHAFMATGLYLSDRGAIAGSYTSEKNAACRYYSGSSCTKSSLIASYGNSVMALADKIQRTMIDQL